LAAKAINIPNGFPVPVIDFRQAEMQCRTIGHISVLSNVIEAIIPSARLKLQAIIGLAALCDYGSQPAVVFPGRSNHQSTLMKNSIYRNSRPDLSLNKLLWVLATILAGISSGNSQTAVITGDLTAPPAYTSVDISADTTDWAYFGLGGGVTDIDSKAGGPASFSPIANGASVGTDSRIFLSFEDGTPTSSTTDERNFVFPQQTALGTLSFDTTLFSPDETIQIYLAGFDSRGDFTASLSSGATFSLTDQVLPYSDDGDGTGQNHTYGLLTLTISGAAVDDVLTFTSANNYDNVSNSSFGSIGIQAATATAITIVPEPSSVTLIAMGTLVGFLGFRKKLKAC
jgi:hypothetical protein